MGYRNVKVPSSERRERAISDRHSLLVDHYFASNFNKTEAMRRAGYKQGRKQSAEMFRHPNVMAEIERRQERLRKRWELNENWVIERLMKLADANTGDILMKLQQNGYDLTALSPEERYAISTLTTEYDKHGEVRQRKVGVEARLGPLVALCRKLGLFQDSLEVKGELNLVDRIRAGRARAAVAGD